ncbi:phospholipase [Schizosaccharomyces cryophilus OY26]|uniref:Acyl-protein thioesterase 1 n=1 Tax=Schizosaccharomyces cryophilus (strain OY26 / ATCC MYA-4695 / CBS 11777 / NBRC 106824 / NRRL Y48691) TaxID=653667 RepID=S9W212_SCHCR|nr:phospholipase [Schizosaccharomyces cryophilus OY26]EPY52070.1 phospholipase [Schizosaccharomyces cryophilus OY26]
MASKITSAIINPSLTHKATVIFFHGLGDSGYGWSFMAEQFKSMGHVKWIFPNAPTIPVTANNNFKMPAWFDIYSLENLNKQDEEGILHSVSILHQLIDAEVAAGISSDKILIGGFSQGCMISLFAGLTYPKRLAGIMGHSGFLPLEHKFPESLSDAARSIPIFLGYMRDDPIVPSALSNASAEHMKQKLHLKCMNNPYDGDMHSPSPESFIDMYKFALSTIGSS